MVKVKVESLDKDPNFRLIKVSLKSEKGGKIHLEVPEGIIRVEKGSEGELVLAKETPKERGENILVMRGVVYENQKSSKLTKISFYGLWMTIKGEEELSSGLNPGDQIYLLLKFR